MCYATRVMVHKRPTFNRLIIIGDNYKYISTQSFGKFSSVSERLIRFFPNLPHAKTAEEYTEVHLQIAICNLVVQ